MCVIQEHMFYPSLPQVLTSGQLWFYHFDRRQIHTTLQLIDLQPPPHPLVSWIFCSRRHFGSILYFSLILVPWVKCFHCHGMTWPSCSTSMAPYSHFFFFLDTLLRSIHSSQTIWVISKLLCCCHLSTCHVHPISVRLHHPLPPKTVIHTHLIHAVMLFYHIFLTHKCMSSCYQDTCHFPSFHHHS